MGLYSTQLCTASSDPGAEYYTALQLSPYKIPITRLSDFLVIAYSIHR